MQHSKAVSLVSKRLGVGVGDGVVGAGDGVVAKIPEQIYDRPVYR